MSPSLCNFLFSSVDKKFEITSLDLKVYDDSKTEVDEEVIEFLIKRQDLGVLEICPQGPNLDGEFLISSLLYIHLSNPG